MTTHGRKKSLLELTKMYNRAFRTPVDQHPVSSEEMGEALKKLAIFKVSVFCDCPSQLEANQGTMQLCVYLSFVPTLCPLVHICSPDLHNVMNTIAVSCTHRGLLASFPG